MNEELIRVYLDTSIIGGVFDPEFAVPTRSFISRIPKGGYELVLSSVVADEIRHAPVAVREVFHELAKQGAEFQVNESALALRRKYVEASAVSPKWEIDALHVACATVARCHVILSWNFKHIVNFKRISVYNAVNVNCGYAPIAIHSPLEMIEDEY